MYYEDVFRQLNKKKVRYVVVGGVAVNLYGVPRVTADLDLLMDLDRSNLLKLVNALEELGYRPRAPVVARELADPEKREMWQKEKNMMVFSFYHPRLPYQQVDIFLDNPMDFEKAEAEKRTVTAKGIKIPLLSINHLIRMKKSVGRKQDLADAEALQKVKRLLREKKREKG